MKYQIDKTRKEYTYAEKIISGKYLADAPEQLACRRFLNDLERQNDDDFPYCYDTTRADKFFKFFEMCPNTEAPNGELLKLAHFQYFDFGNIFGWVRKDNGARRWRNALIYEARGQGKSSVCAVVTLYILTADKMYPPYQIDKGVFEPNQQICLMAVDKDQTKHVRAPVIGMVNMSPRLQKEVDCGKGETTKTYIRGKRRGGEVVAISKETGKADGEKLNLIICDEWAAHKEEGRLATLKGSFGKRRQSICIKITTAGEDCQTKPAFEDYNRCLEILHGRVIDERYFIIIRQLGEKDDPADFSLYEKCAPMLREKTAYSQRLLEDIQAEYNEAFNGGTEKQKIEYLIKRTNRWQVGGEQKFLTQEMLDKLVASQIPEEEFLKLIKGRPTICGVDASKVIDLTAESFIYNLPDSKIGIMAHAFMPSESRDRHLKTDKLPYDSYERDGNLTYIDGVYIDNAYLKDHMNMVETEYGCDIKAVCADNAYCQQLLIDLTAGRTPSGKVYDVWECPQTTTVLNEPCINFQKWLLSGKLVICQNELFMKHCANAYVEYDKGGRMKVAKKNKDSYFRIDLLAATLNAIRKIDLLERNNLSSAVESERLSFYD